MPTYVYRRADGTQFEAFQKISADALTECPDTGQPVQRVISGGAGLQFKGDGFYLTDYVHTGQKDRAEAKSAASPSGKSSSESASPKATESSTKAAPAKAASSTSASSSDD